MGGIGWKGVVFQDQILSQKSRSVWEVGGGWEGEGQGLISLKAVPK